MKKILMVSVVFCFCCFNTEAQEKEKENEITINQKIPITNIDTTEYDLMPIMDIDTTEYDLMPIMVIDYFEFEPYGGRCIGKCTGNIWILYFGFKEYSHVSFTYNVVYSTDFEVFYTQDSWYIDAVSKKLSVIFSNNIKINIISDNGRFEIPAEYLYLFKDYTIKSFTKDDKTKIDNIHTYFNELFKLVNLSNYIQQVDSINTTNPYYTRYKFVHGEFVDTFKSYEDIEKNNKDKVEYSRKKAKEE